MGNTLYWVKKKICGQKKILGLEKIRAKRGFFLTTQGRKIDAHFQIKFARNTVYNQQFWNQVPKHNDEWAVSHRSGEKVSKQTRTVKTESVIRHCEKEDRERRQGSLQEQSLTQRDTKKEGIRNEQE